MTDDADLPPEAEPGSEPDHAQHPRLDHEALYESALDISLQWFNTWDLTGNRRHLATALVCSRMARERFRAMMTQRVERRLSGRSAFTARQDALEQLVVHAIATQDVAEVL